MMTTAETLDTLIYHVTQVQRLLDTLPTSTKTADPSPPDFDALTDAEVVAWAEGWRIDPDGYWIDPKDNRARHLPFNSARLKHFDDYLTALDAVFAKCWALRRPPEGFWIEYNSNDVGPYRPTPTAAAVAAIRQALKERTI